jgi:hypothetical protein
LDTARLGFSVWSEKDISDTLELWGNPEVTKYLEIQFGEHGRKYEKN